MAAFNTNQVTTSCTEEKFYRYGPGALVTQCFATFVVSLANWTSGILQIIPVIVMGKVLDSKYDSLSLNEEEASWFGSLRSLLQPVGIFVGILFVDFYSRRYGLLISNALALISLMILHFASAASIALLSTAVMGLSSGFAAPSGVSFITEYSETEIRGLLGLSSLFAMYIGEIVTSFFATMVDWRTLLLTSAIIPFVSIILLPQIPDSPIWLLSKGRKSEALEALKWFRGWVREGVVAQEFDDLENYVKESLTCGWISDDVKSEQSALLAKRKQSNLSELLSSILERRTIYPLFLMTVFILTHLAAQAFGVWGNAVSFLESLHLPFDSYFLVFILSLERAVGTLVLVFIVKYTGKRIVTLVAVLSSALMTIGIAIFMYYKDVKQMPWIFIVIAGIQAVEISQAEMVQCFMAGEVFPVRTRSAGLGMTHAINSLLRFFFIKTYFSAIHTLGSELYLLMCGILGMIGYVYLYIYLPETEHKSLIEVEKIFTKTSGAHHCWTDTEVK